MVEFSTEHSHAPLNLFLPKLEVAKVALDCAQLFHPPNPERAETRSCPRRAQFHVRVLRARRAPGRSLLTCPLRSLSLPPPRIGRGAWFAPNCARPTRAFIGRALREHRGLPSRACISFSAPRTMYFLRLTPWLFECARSASMKGTWPLLSHLQSPLILSPGMGAD